MSDREKAIIETLREGNRELRAERGAVYETRAAASGEAECPDCSAAMEPLSQLRDAEIERMREALTEIRDLARTGLPPTGMTEEYWRAHKINKIAAEADAALRGE